MTTEIAVVNPTTIVVPEFQKPTPDDVLTAARRVAGTGIQSPQQAQGVVKLLEVVQALEARVTEAFGPAVQAAHEAHKRILAARDAHTDVLEEAEKLLRAALNQFIKKNGKDAVQGIQARSRWSYVVEDLSKIPREYLMVDDKKLKAVARAMKLDMKIPGVRVVENATAAISKKGNQEEVWP